MLCSIILIISVFGFHFCAHRIFRVLIRRLHVFPYFQAAKSSGAFWSCFSSSFDSKLSPGTSLFITIFASTSKSSMRGGRFVLINFVSSFSSAPAPLNCSLAAPGSRCASPEQGSEAMYSCVTRLTRLIFQTFNFSNAFNFLIF